jgi:glc operon protein GlcG
MPAYLLLSSRQKQPSTLGALKVLEDAVAGGGSGLRFLSISNVCVIEGGILLLVEGKIVGAIGVSGMQPTQDAQVAAAGAAALKG